MKDFVDIHINRESRFSLGIETNSGIYYLSFPVANTMADYEEFYKIDKEFVDNYPESLDKIQEILVRCRERQYDDHLFYEPGRDRGYPI
ncbi:MAG: hypothetical protein JKY50_02790 [Oleispira sp.]|nr:hypothetical protein [Oleispira sp.]